jgi:hypothetical protein
MGAACFKAVAGVTTGDSDNPLRSRDIDAEAGMNGIGDSSVCPRFRVSVRALPTPTFQKAKRGAASVTCPAHRCLFLFTFSSAFDSLGMRIF